jgi:hypothetical protein
LYLVLATSGRIQQMAFTFTREHLHFFESGLFASVEEFLQRQTERYVEPLRLQTMLRKRFPLLSPGMAAAAVALSALRNKAVEKCGLPANCFCTQEGYEMASSRALAELHAALLPGGGRIIDCCAGIGSDAVRFAANGEVIAIEADAVTAAMCRHNLRSAGADAAVIRSRVELCLPSLRMDDSTAIFADPARRSDGRRTHDAASSSPPLSFFHDIAAEVPMLVKIAPAARVEDASWGRIWAASGRECKEQLVHRGLDLPARCVIDAESGLRWTPVPCDAPDVREAAWLIEPHSAVILSGAVSAYFHEHGARAIDAHIAYGLAEALPPPSPLHQRFRVLRMEAFHRKRLRQAVRDFAFGPGVEIKKRGFPQTPDELRAELPLDGDTDGVILIARRGQGHVMIFAERV